MNTSPWNKDRIIGQKRPLQISHVWGDIVDYHFVCKHCGTQFVLGAETYHGSGGYWSPENEKPSEIFD